MLGSLELSLLADSRIHLYNVATYAVTNDTGNTDLSVTQNSVDVVAGLTGPSSTVHALRDRKRSWYRKIDTMGFVGHRMDDLSYDWWRDTGVVGLEFTTQAGDNGYSVAQT